jgi:hypothetical protein
MFNLTNVEQVGLAEALGRGSVRISDGMQAILTKVFHDFHHFLEANAKIVCHPNHDPFHPSPLSNSSSIHLFNAMKSAIVKRHFPFVQHLDLNPSCLYCYRTTWSFMGDNTKIDVKAMR